MEKRRGCRHNDTFLTKRINSGLRQFDGVREIGLPDVAARNQTERKNYFGTPDDIDDLLKLVRSTVEVDVETSDGQFGDVCKI